MKKNKFFYFNKLCGQVVDDAKKIALDLLPVDESIL